MDKLKNKRLQSEFKYLQTGLPDGIICSPKGDRLDHYEARINGPPDSPYENGRFFVDVVLSESYGVDPPSMKFLTRIYHPNIDDHGNICLDVLKSGSKSAWKPSWTLDKVLIALRVLLETPNAQDPLMPEIAEQMMSDHAAFTKTAAEWTARYATAFNDDPSDYIPMSQLDASPASAQGGAKSPGGASITKIKRKPSAETNASLGGKCKLGLSRKPAVPASASESPAPLIPPPGPGKPVSSGMRRLGLSRSRNAATTKLPSSSAAGSALSASPSPSEGTAAASQTESIEVSDDYSSGSNSLLIAKSAMTSNSCNSRSPASMKPAKASNLSEILSSSKSAGHKRPLKLTSVATLAETPASSCSPASENRKRKRLVNKAQSSSPPPLLPSWLDGEEESEELCLLSSQQSDGDYECLLDPDDKKTQVLGHFSDTLSESLAGAGSLRADLSADLGACEGHIDEPISAGVAPAVVQVAKEPPKEASPCKFLKKQASFLPDLPQPAPKPKASERAVPVVTAKRKDKGKAVDCQPPLSASRREHSVQGGQILDESHFGPLDLGLKPIRVSANRSLMRRKPRKSDDAI
ncbi:Ubiquitin-conjugating enzyme E2 T [Coemansia sp. RSA 2050]|nr:Ubiquitin-conjugating enzyme E2 T [Coemansia sp. RSA 2050]KAJ2734375.1 Ubiquitin-conjugating enzyme E2 T [Coemansia sp. BCRC 34962]